MKTEILSSYKSSQIKIKEPTKQTHKSFRTSIKFSRNENLKMKGLKITELRQKSEPRKTVIFNIELEISSYL